LKVETLEWTTKLRRLPIFGIALGFFYYSDHFRENFKLTIEEKRRDELHFSLKEKKISFEIEFSIIG
jgi:hypothetical protein